MQQPNREAPSEAVELVRRTGTELFHDAGTPLGFELLSFWQWACSNVRGNALRGLVAEFLVAKAVAADAGVRTEWDACDVVTSAGTKIEVKTSAYLQTWKQTRLSAIKFDIAPKRSWDAVTNTTATAASRCAHVYVFAIHAHRDKLTLDPLDVSQWEFHVVPTAVLDARCPTQKTLGLSSLLRLAPTKATFAELGHAINTCVRHEP